MDAIQSKYQKRKTLYLVLMAAMVVLAIVFRLTAVPGDQNANRSNLLKFASLAVIILVARNVFRCPQCEASLAQAFYSSLCQLRRCPKCRALLKED
ncbi:hypothetical protein F6V30_08650 [Oryzomonas sagensis]|uniref:Uncharacterized protein n=1 Tax=Oryzomonas sagensis TaxID=2603857 RepID=A0ABQ6TNL1_9BACT|nr:hypothetical protein [Oryzomonas sagensis]KAB0670219.1 hypothetical protein F6V30_08650 [Oryzomonas sagensis]